ncbi:MAG: glycosyltransferase family 2 protein [Holophagaceae bacterium]|nr:glycosyltransferase family 2 protein [Holophagaceae bacterium]
MPAPFQLLMPSYNQAHFIGEAVESVLKQEDPDWELWIVDNSSDETPKVMAAFTDPRIHFIHEPRRMDPGTCLNLMLEKAKGRGAISRTSTPTTGCCPASSGTIARRSLDIL